MQSLAAQSRWAMRNAVPLAPPGNIRMLDAVEHRFAQGAGSPGLTAYLRRAGVGYLVVRNDLRRSPDVPDPVLVHQAIDDSPGLSLAATLRARPWAVTPTSTGRPAASWSTAAGRRSTPPSRSTRWRGRWPRPVGGHAPPVVAGGPEDLLDLLTSA